MKAKSTQGLRKNLGAVLVLLTMGVSMNVFGFLGFGVDSWKEEVLLHDGSTLIVERSQTYGGRREVGQSAPIKEHTISFALPGSGKSVTWTSEFSEDVGRANFNLLAVHMRAETPYLVTEPNLCLSYNKWGRPNPPYVFFKYDGKEWKRIPLAELPVEFKTINATVSLGDYEVKTMVEVGTVSAGKIKKANSELRQPEYMGILREAVAAAGRGCPELVRIEGGWESPGGSRAPIPISPNQSKKNRSENQWGQHEVDRLFRTRLKVDNIFGGVKWERQSARLIRSASGSGSAKSSRSRQFVCWS